MLSQIQVSVLITAKEVDYCHWMVRIFHQNALLVRGEYRFSLFFIATSLPKCREHFSAIKKVDEELEKSY